MSTRTRTQMKATVTPTASFTPVPRGLLQRTCACGGSPGVDGECAECRSKRLGMQRRATTPASPSVVPPLVHDVLHSPGQPLDSATRSYMEPRFGHDFSQVRVHTDERAAQSAQAVNALAYTVGRDVVFGAGQYAPGTTAGKGLLAHELTHTIQQSQGWATGMAKASSPQVSAPNDAYEQEAETQATQVMAGGTAHGSADEEATPPDLSCIATVGPGHLAGVDIPFAVNSVALSTQDKRRIAAFARDWSTQGSKDDVNVDGYASQEGPHDFNWKLSCQRAEAVKAELIAAGVPGNKITVFAHGPSTEFSRESLSRNRRVTISSVRGTPPTPNPPRPGSTPQPTPTPAESRSAPKTVEITTKSPAQVTQNEQVKPPQVEIKPKDRQTITPATPPAKEAEKEEEPPFQFTALVGVQNAWRLAGDAPSHDRCDYGVIQVGGKWNWQGLHFRRTGDRLSLFSEPELDVNLLPLLCNKSSGITLQDNFIKVVLMKKILELSLQGVFGLQDGWLESWKDKPLTGQVGNQLDWKPWGNRDNKWYSNIKLSLNVSVLWQHQPEGQKDFWGLNGQASIGIELP